MATEVPKVSEKLVVAPSEQQSDNNDRNFHEPGEIQRNRRCRQLSKDPRNSPFFVNENDNNNDNDDDIVYNNELEKQDQREEDPMIQEKRKKITGERQRNRRCRQLSVDPTSPFFKNDNDNNNVNNNDNDNNIVYNNEQENQDQPEEDPMIQEERKKILEKARSRVVTGLLIPLEEINCHQGQLLSSFIMKRHGKDIPNATLSQFELGKTLGTGAFGLVRVVNRSSPSAGAGGNDDDPCLVVKSLKPELLEQNTSSVWKIAADLVKEGALLAELNDHEHILQLVGWTAKGIDGFFPANANMNNNVNATSNEHHHSLLQLDGFCLVLKRLSESLTEKLAEWRGKEEDRDCEPHCDEFWNERLDVLKQFAEGIEHMHSHRIVHRDLKPGNVGFDYRDPNLVKIFDFNIARKLPPTIADNEADEVFRLTRKVGSLRYMAPEVGLKNMYNHKVDIYAFGLLAYETLALPQHTDVFHQICAVEEHQIRVFVGGERPPLPSRWPEDLRNLIERSWSASIQERPSAETLKNFFTYQPDRNPENMLFFRSGTGLESNATDVDAVAVAGDDAAAAAAAAAATASRRPSLAVFVR
uniref:Protein kinase domain-containing protein n=1 Tax=Pseudo-nitzschia australis TaxID=44445 RepID=A0A7S4AQ06_9STRA